MAERIVPRLPEKNKQLRLLIDTDAANEIDDLYALALAFRAPERFCIEGIVATHFAQKAGRETIEHSYRVIQELLEAGNLSGRYRVVKGGDPIPYVQEPVDSPGARLINELTKNSNGVRPNAFKKGLQELSLSKHFRLATLHDPRAIMSRV